MTSYCNLSLAAPESSDGYLCYWRECDFACSSKDEMDRHVYFHGFHGKIKSLGLILMGERNDKVSYSLITWYFSFKSI